MSEVIIELLAAAMRQAGCPVCSVIRGMVFDELCQLQRQALVDTDTHADVVRRGGYCRDHFWSLDELASSVTNAALLAPLMERVSDAIDSVGRELSAGSGVLRQPTTEIAERLGAPRTCRVCEQVQFWERSALAVLCAMVEDAEQREQYQRSHGLCLPHLAQALSTCADTALSEVLLRAAGAQARRLAGQLNVYVRKWDEHDRSFGAEETAPRAAVEKLVGGRERGR